MKSHVSILRIAMFLFAGIISFSCQKSIMKEVAPPAVKSGVKVTGKFAGKDGFMIYGNFQFNATETKTSTDYYTRQIEVIYIPTGEILNTFMLRVENTDPNVDLYDAVSNHSFTGIFTISSNGYIFLTKQADKGSNVDLPNNGFDYDMALLGIPINLEAVSGCVLKNINADWTSYINDMIETPDNYLWQWAGCEWKN